LSDNLLSVELTLLETIHIEPFFLIFILELSTLFDLPFILSEVIFLILSLNSGNSLRFFSIGGNLLVLSYLLFSLLDGLCLHHGLSLEAGLLLILAHVNILVLGSLLLILLDALLPVGLLLGNELRLK
jgi:hypothetical protein